MEETFNIKDLSYKNVTYAFENLIFYITASSQIGLYAQYETNFLVVLNKINYMYEMYKAKHSLKVINDEIFANIRYDLLGLSNACKVLGGYYAEWALQWFDIIYYLKINETELNNNIEKKK